MDIAGIDGRSIHERWREGASAYPGLSVPQFPNLLLMYGPNTNLGGGSIVYMLEQPARYTVQYVQILQTLGLRYAVVCQHEPAAYNRQPQQPHSHPPLAALCPRRYTGTHRTHPHTN